MLAANRSGGSKRLMALLLSVIALFSVAQIEAAPPAKAATSNYWSTITWDITGLASGGTRPASNYRSMIRQIRELSGTSIATNMARTTSATERYIEIMVTDFNEPPATQHRLSLYLRLDNLYLDGFTVSGQNYAFSDAPNYLNTRFHNQYPRNNPLFNVLRYSSHYSDLASAETRAAQHFSGPSFYYYVSTLFGVSGGSVNQVRPHLAAMIGATSEASRFGWIENRIANSVAYGQDSDGGRSYDYLGNFGAELENSWDELSRLVYREQQGNLPVPSVTIDSRVYHHISDIVNGRADTPKLIPFLTHGSAR
ncbi:ribosome-inactivating family protein [Streptomyces sp. NRRL S-350]|uniref:ribosome-inactivating family protein n=1 Tax=Streptomyces sp. NRRL S-350 TaxID=1463902 RepID=UPI00131AE79B|nr:ribosome-inactivating family protein [Streptomyces sp. NRRL S-350]